MYSRSITRFASALAACAAVSLVTFTSVAHAQITFISTNTTLDSTNPITQGRLHFPAGYF